MKTAKEFFCKAKQRIWMWMQFIFAEFLLFIVRNCTSALYKYVQNTGISKRFRGAKTSIYTLLERLAQL
jgi:hypothetical protein